MKRMLRALLAMVLATASGSMVLQDGCGIGGYDDCIGPDGYNWCIAGGGWDQIHEPSVTPYIAGVSDEY